MLFGNRLEKSPLLRTSPVGSSMERERLRFVFQVGSCCRAENVHVIVIVKSILNMELDNQILR